MSDDISIPRSALSGTAPGRTSFTHSYRSRRAGMDVGTKRLVVAASALGLLLAGGMAVWSFGGGHREIVVPRIEADTRPMRIKPENPGGMTAIGVGESSVTSGRGDLAPPAEQPDPQALLAQRHAAAAPRIAAPAPVPSASPPAAAPTPAAPPATEAASRPRPGPAGPLVQLAALESEAGATAEWQRLTRKLPDLLGDRRPVVQRSDQGGKAFWRLRTGGFSDLADATQFCKRVRAKGLGCSLANF